MKKHTIYSAIAVLLLGCKQPCTNDKINPAFIGFALSDIDTLVLRAYQPNDNFQHLVDTILVVNPPAIYTTSNDTTIVYISTAYGGDGNPMHWIVAGYDWQIYIPARNRTVFLTQIISPSTERSGRFCYNPISSFVQDGQTIIPQYVVTANSLTWGYRVYIHY